MENTASKSKKSKFVTIKALPGSIIVTPKEIKAFKNHGINLLVLLKKVQREIYKPKQQHAG